MGQFFLQALPIFLRALRGGGSTCRYLLARPGGDAPEPLLLGCALGGNYPVEVCTVLSHSPVFCQEVPVKVACPSF